jgi:DNA repair exonuclease SbcCD ATPase subunit
MASITQVNQGVPAPFTRLEDNQIGFFARWVAKPLVDHVRPLGDLKNTWSNAGKIQAIKNLFFGAIAAIATALVSATVIGAVLLWNEYNRQVINEAFIAGRGSNEDYQEAIAQLQVAKNNETTLKNQLDQIQLIVSNAFDLPANAEISEENLKAEQDRIYNRGKQQGQHLSAQAVANASLKATAAENKVIRLNDQLNDKNTELTDARQQIDALNETIRRNKREYSLLQTAFNDANNTVTSLTTQLENTQKSIEASNKQLGESNLMLTNLRDQLQEKEEINIRLNADLTKTNGDLATLADQLKIATDRVALLEAQIKDNTHELDELRNKLATAEHARDDVMDQLNQTTVYVNALEQAYDSADVEKKNTAPANSKAIFDSLIQPAQGDGNNAIV